MDDNPTRRTVLQRFGAVAATAAIAGCTSGTDENSDRSDRATNSPTESPTDSPTGTNWPNPNDQDTETLTGEIEIVEMETSVDSAGYVHVVGSIKNVTDRKFRYVEVNAYLYNDAGERVGDGLDNFNNVRPGETVRYECRTMAEEHEVAEYEVTVHTN